MIKSILFKGQIKGRGVVNFDSNAQRWVLKDRFPQERDYFSHDNVKIAKHVFYQRPGPDGQTIWERRLCISSDCLRQAIFGDDFPFQNTAIMQHPDLLYRVIASVPALLRGYLFAEEGKPTLKRKSPVMITAAEQVSDGVTHFEIGSMSGAKRSRSNEDEAGDTSMHYEEKIGEVVYAFEGALDLKELQFVSLSETYDRMAVNPDFADKFRELLGRRLGSPVDERRFFLMKSALIRTPEEGILLTPAQVVVCVREFFRRLLRARIQRAKAYAHMDQVEIKFVRDPLTDTFEDRAGWRLLKTEDDLNLNPSDVEIAYEAISDDEARAIYETIAAEAATTAQRKKADRESRRRAKEDGPKSADR